MTAPEKPARFVDFWPDQARLVHTRDRAARAPWRAMCGAWTETDEGEEYTVPDGEDWLRCATCVKTRAARDTTTRSTT